MTRAAPESAEPQSCEWVRLPTVEALERLGAAIAARLRPGDLVCLSGPLGAGKTTLARGLVRGLTTPAEEVPSPTFTLVQTYEAARFPLAHFDLYRLKTPEEAFELGLDEALEEGAAVVEWPERLGDLVPPDRLDVELRIPDRGDGRLARLIGRGAWAAKIGDRTSVGAAA